MPLHKNSENSLIPHVYNVTKYLFLTVSRSDIDQTVEHDPIGDTFKTYSRIPVSNFFFNTEQLLLIINSQKRTKEHQPVFVYLFHQVC